MRHDGRADDALRPVRITRRFTQTPAGSVLWQQGQTIVLCTASITAKVPEWFRPDRPGGWVTADYVMLPASTPQRKDWPKIGHTDARGTEIQRLIGRALRAVVDMSKIGPHTIALDCQVLQADGGTRSAAICGASLALADALRKLPRELPAGAAGAGAYDPDGALTQPLAAVSVGVVDGRTLLDLDYHEDARAEVDMNVAYTSAGSFVEVQASAEKGPGMPRAKLLELLDLAARGCQALIKQAAG